MFRIPPLSPSTNTIELFFFVSSIRDTGTELPSIEITFLKPFLRSVNTSALPSTMMISSASSIAGPHGRRSLPKV